MSDSSSCCGLCRYPRSDIRLVECGCTLHARCIPLDLIAKPCPSGKSPTTDGLSYEATSPGEVACPCCSAAVQGIYLIPMSLEELNRAVQIKKEMAFKSKQQQQQVPHRRNENGKRDRSDSGCAGLDEDHHFLSVQAESSYLLLSHNTQGNGATSDGDFLRTGRWTEDETHYVDCLVEAFDRGQLPLPHGIRLNDFLRDILLCKASRLTKKMKNAKLSSRSFDLRTNSSSSSSSAGSHNNPQQPKVLNRDLLSSLQEAFLNSVSQEHAQLELRFNITKAWRSLFSNLCLQLGSSMLQANDWIVSLEEMERRAADADEMIRKARRRRMGMALKADTVAVSSSRTASGVFFSGVPVQKEQQPMMLSTKQPDGTKASSYSNAIQEQTGTWKNGMNPPSMIDSNWSSNNSVSDHSECSYYEDPLISSMLDMGSGDNAFHHLDSRTVPSFGHKKESEEENDNDEIAQLFRDFDGNLTAAAKAPPSNTHHRPSSSPGISVNSQKGIRNNCGPFLDAIVLFIEQNDLPFQHVDVWVPSFTPASSSAASCSAHTCTSKQEDSSTVAAGNLNPTGNNPPPPTTTITTTTEVRLYHAGHATRSDIDPVSYGLLREYGNYSTRFSFQSGFGLPGRVYATGQPMWERHIGEADPEHFKRAGGAKVYGVQTGLALPMASAAIGRMVVGLYSTRDMEPCPNLTLLCKKEMGKFRPEPKWKLVVEMGPELCDPSNVPDQSMLPEAISAPPVSEFSMFPPSLSNAAPVTSTSFSVPVTISTPPTTTRQLVHDRSESFTSMSTIGSQSLVSNPMDPLEEEQKIAALLGDHMPLDDSALSFPGCTTSVGSSPSPSSSMEQQPQQPFHAMMSSTAAGSTLVPLFMSLRLLMLRSPSRRSYEDNEIIEVIRRSYRGYSKDSKQRTEQEIAFLLVKDFTFLQAAPAASSFATSVAQQQPQPPPPPLSYQQQQQIQQIIPPSLVYGRNRSGFDTKVCNNISSNNVFAKAGQGTFNRSGDNNRNKQNNNRNAVSTGSGRRRTTTTTTNMTDNNNEQQTKLLYKSHVMNAPAGIHTVSTGLPKMMPSLPFVDPAKIRRGSFENLILQTQEQTLANNNNNNNSQQL